MREEHLHEKIKTLFEENKEEVLDILEDVFYEIKKNHPMYYRECMERMESLGKHKEDISEEEARYFVGKLENADGSKGAHWDSSAVQRIIRECPKLQDYPFWTVYIAMNMIFSDFYMPQFDTRMYCELTYKFLHDRDARRDKLKWYIENIRK